MSPCAPPYCCRTVLSAMISTLSPAMMIKGQKPKVSTRRMILAEYPPKLILTWTRSLNKNHSTNAQEQACEMTVAMAAPLTPMLNRKMKMGSRMMFITAPMMVESIASLAKPWQVMNCPSPAVRMANTVPET